MGAGVRRLPRCRRPASARCASPGRSPTCTARSSATGAVMSGWLARAQTLLGGAGSRPRAAGWRSTSACSKRDRARKEAALPRGARGRPAGSATPTWSSSTLAYLGASLVHADRTEEGMLLLDEALAAVAGSEVDDFCVLEEIFCQLFSACEHAHDVDRGRPVDPRSARRSPRGGKLPAVSAFCRTHYGGVAHRGRAVARGRRGADRGGAALGARPALAARRRARPAGRPARPAGPVRGGRAAARRARRRRRRRTPAGGHPPRARRDVRSPGTSSSGRWTRSTRRARPPRHCWRCSSTSTSPRNCSTRPTAAVERLVACADRHPSAYLARRGRAGPRAGSAWPTARATRRPACARRSPASPRPRCRWSSPTPGSSWPTPCSPTGPRSAMAEARAALDGVRAAAGRPPRRRGGRGAAIARRPDGASAGRAAGC